MKEFFPKHKNLVTSIGFGYSFSSIPKVFSIPLEVSYLFGEKNHYFETGFGLTYLGIRGLHFENYSSNILAFCRLGYKYVSPKGLLLRVGLTPVYDKDNYFYSFGWINPSIGISIGYSF